jgi:hypothetical protein
MLRAMTEPILPRSRPGGMLRRLLSVFALMSLVMLAAPTARVFACSCPRVTPAVALANAEVAFVGVVAAIDDPNSGPLVGSGDALRYTFAIEQTLKGAPKVSLEIGSARSSASCGQEFAAAQRWRVFAYADEAGQLQTGLCSGNELLAENAPLPPQTPAPPPTALLLAIGAGIVVVGISALAFMRRGSKASA